MTETATYKINQSAIPGSAKCANPRCGHSMTAHGSNGMICAGCPCLQFVAPAVKV